MHSMLLCRSWSSRRVINGAWVQGHQPQSVYNEHFLEPSGTTSNHQPNRNKSAEGTGWTILVLRGKKNTSVWWTKSATKHAVKLLRAMLPLTELLCEFPSEKKQSRPISCWPCKCYSTRLGESWYSIVSIPCIARTSLVLGSIRDADSPTDHIGPSTPRCNTPRIQSWTTLHLDSNRPE